MRISVAPSRLKYLADTRPWPALTPRKFVFLQRFRFESKLWKGARLLLIEGPPYVWKLFVTISVFMRFNTSRYDRFPETAYNLFKKACKLICSGVWKALGIGFFNVKFVVEIMQMSLVYDWFLVVWNIFLAIRVSFGVISFLKVIWNLGWLNNTFELVMMISYNINDKVQYMKVLIR